MNFLRFSPVFQSLLIVQLLFVVAGSTLISAANASDTQNIKFQRIYTQFIAALGDPQASSGNGAQEWGLWRKDPGPRGVWLRDYERLHQRGGAAPAGWMFDSGDWWLEENGILMEKPKFPMPPGQYLVTGDREVTTVLTIHPAEEDGNRKWELANDAVLYDVTHLPCRSARYTSQSGIACTPANANQSQFPVDPGAVMPAVEGCAKQDYAVLFIIGVTVDQ